MDEKQNEKYMGGLRKGIMAECVLILVLAALSLGRQEGTVSEKTASSHVLSIENDYIKWVDFTVSYEALCQAYEWDVKTYETEYEIDWVELLAFTAARTGGEFGRDALKTMEKTAEKLSEGECTMEELTEDLKYYPYYKEAYDAAIGGLVGDYWEEAPGTGGGGVTGNEAENFGSANTANYVKRYGLKGYFPLARGFDYTHYDDFGAGRSYGYQRKHLGSYVIIVSS